MPVFAKSYIYKKLTSEADAHHWELSVGDLKVSQYHPRNGFTCSFSNLLICRENTQDSLLYVNAISAKVAMALKGGLHVTTRDIESDYAFLSLQSDNNAVSQHDVGDEKDYPHKLKKMLQLFTEFFPEQLSSRKIVLATQESDFALQYDIDSLTICGDSLSGHCTQIANDTIVRFQISGNVQPRENVYNGHITLVDNPCNDHVRLLKGRLNTEFLCDDLSFGLKVDQTSGNNASLTLSGQVKNAQVDNPKIAAEKLAAERTIGMQGLVDAVRSTGAKNLVSAGGLDWAYTLDGVLEGYALDDGNLMYESHCYPWKRHWKKAFLDAAGKFPVLMGEVGAQDTPMPFEKPGDFVPPEDWVPDMLATIQEHRLNWTAWCFHPKASPCLITGWDYEPTPYWGVFAKRALAGERFEPGRMH